MTFKRFAFASTALSLSCATAAFAQSNDAYLDQLGNANVASIDQSGSGARVGTLTDAATQNGDGNSLTILQTGSGRAGTPPSAWGQYSEGIDQDGDNNVLSVTQTFGSRLFEVQQDATGASSAPTGTSNSATVNQSGNAAISNVNQTYTGDGSSGTANAVTITQTGSQFQRNIVGEDGFTFRYRGENGGVVQDGSANVAILSQTGANNTITYSEQTGTGNASTLTQAGGQRNRVRAAIQRGSDNTLIIDQFGNDNGNGDFDGGSYASSIGVTAGTATQVFEGTAPGTDNFIEYRVTGSRNEFGFNQRGANNSVGLVTINGDDNDLAVQQSINGNILDVSAINGSRNDIGVFQRGLENYASLTLSATSDDNAVRIQQLTYNFASAARSNAVVTIDGDLNDVNLLQRYGSVATVDITGDSNILVGEQFDTSTMTVTIDGDLNNNVLGGFGGSALGVGLLPGYVIQTGAGNTFTTTVTGDSNQFAGSQIGDNNVILATVSGNGNQFAAQQNANANTFNLNQAGNNNNAGVSQ